MQTFLQLLNGKDILFHAINAVILLVAIRFLLYRPVRRFMDTRAEKLASQTGEAEARLSEANLAMAQLERAQEQARIEANQDLAQRLATESEALLHKAREQAEDIVKAARRDAEAIRQSAQEDLQRQAVTMAVEMTEKMLGRELQDADNQKMVSDFLTKVG